MNPVVAVMAAGKAADEGTKQYDKLSKWAMDHGWDLDAAVGDIANRLKDKALDTPDITDVIRALKETPYEEGDFEEIYEDDLNGDGDKDVTAMDTSGDGEIDTVVTTSDSDNEEKDAEDEAKDILDDEEKTSVGKNESELNDNTEFPKDYNSDSVDEDGSEPMVGGQTWKDLLSAIIEQRSMS